MAIGKLKEEIEILNKKLLEQRDRNNAQEEKIKVVTTQNQAFIEEAKGLQDKVAQKDKIIKEKEGKVTNLEGWLDARDKTISKKTEEVTILRRDLEKSRKEMEALKESIKETAR